MKKALFSEFKSFISLLMAAFIFGYINHFTYSCIIAVLFAYICWHWYQLSRFQRWLKNQNTEDAPYSIGVWGEIFRLSRNLYKKNIKRQQRLKSSVNRMRDSTAALSDAVLLVDCYGRLEWWNQSASFLLGLKQPVDIGQPLMNLIRHPKFKAYFEQEEYDEPLSMVSPVNDKIQLQFKITLFGRRDRLIMVQDITRITQLEKMRKDFVANVSHELRTPLTVVSGYIETMSMQADELPPRWQRMLQQMTEQSLRMSNLIKDLLMLSRLETTASKQDEAVAIRPLLEQIMRATETLNQEKQHQIELFIEQDGDIQGITSELHSAFSNLIFNAIKYTPNKGHIQIKWHVNKQYCQLDVIDNGIGIAPQHIPRLSERFYRIDSSRSQATGGTGLGLAITKHVMRHHQGQLQISSELGVGSQFSCIFPIQLFSTN